MLIHAPRTRLYKLVICWLLLALSNWEENQGKTFRIWLIITKGNQVSDITIILQSEAPEKSVLLPYD